MEMQWAGTLKANIVDFKIIYIIIVLLIAFVWALHLGKIGRIFCANLLEVGDKILEKEGELVELL